MYHTQTFSRQALSWIKRRLEPGLPRVNRTPGALPWLSNGYTLEARKRTYKDYSKDSHEWSFVSIESNALVP